MISEGRYTVIERDLTFRFRLHRLRLYSMCTIAETKTKMRIFRKDPKHQCKKCTPSVCACANPTTNDPVQSFEVYEHSNITNKRTKIVYLYLNPATTAMWPYTMSLLPASCCSRLGCKQARKKETENANRLVVARDVVGATAYNSKQQKEKQGSSFACRQDAHA